MTTVSELVPKDRALPEYAIMSGGWFDYVLIERTDNIRGYWHPLFRCNTHLEADIALSELRTMGKDAVMASGTFTDHSILDEAAEPE